MKYIISVPTKLVFSFLFLFSQKLRSWVFNDQPRRECAVVGLNGSFPAAGGGDLGKKGIAESDCLFPLSKIAHWSILLRGNGVFFFVGFPAAGLGPIVPMIGPIVSMIGPIVSMIGP